MKKQGKDYLPSYMRTASARSCGAFSTDRHSRPSSSTALSAAATTAMRTDMPSGRVDQSDPSLVAEAARHCEEIIKEWDHVVGSTSALDELHSMLHSAQHRSRESLSLADNLLSAILNAKHMLVDRSRAAHVDAGETNVGCTTSPIAHSEAPKKIKGEISIDGTDL
jgi:hypothetical protein